MSNKMVVTFKELPVRAYAIDYLKYCKHCGIYGIGEKACAKCGRDESTSIDKIAENTVRKGLLTRIGIILIGYALMYLLSRELIQLLLATGFCMVLVALLILIYKKYKAHMIVQEMGKHICANIDGIRRDMKKQMKAAISEVDEGNLVAAYDRLRYLSKVMDNDEVRTFKLICLKNFDLRSDMPLEMNSILQADCNNYLIDYIYDIAKIRKDLIDEQTVMYILQYKEQVLSKTKGKQIMASVLEACLRSKYMLGRYAKYMLGYIKYFSKERQLRFCKLCDCIEDEVLKRALLQEIKENAGDQEAFAPYLNKLEEV